MKFDHINIAVSNLKRSVDFYRDIMGFSVIGELKVAEDRSLVFMNAEGGILELSGPKKDTAPIGDGVDKKAIGLNHVGFTVNSVNETIDRLREAGVKITLEPTDAKGGVRIAFFEDPDGTSLEVVEGDLNLTTWESE